MYIDTHTYKHLLEFITLAPHFLVYYSLKHTGDHIVEQEGKTVV